MRKVLISYSRLKADAVLVLCQTVHTQMTGNAHFTTPPVTMVELNGQSTRLESAITAANTRDREKLAVLRNEKSNACDMLRKLANYVNTTAAGNEAVLLTSGFPLSKTPEKHPATGPVAKIDAKFTDLPGIINLMWSRAKHARYYNVFMSSDNGQTWQLLDTVFSRKMLVEGLASGQRYSFKVVPVGQQGSGPVSDITSQVAA